MQMKKDQAFERIIDEANSTNDIVEFGKKVAQILFENGLIDEAVFDLLMGK